MILILVAVLLGVVLLNATDESPPGDVDEEQTALAVEREPRAPRTTVGEADGEDDEVSSPETETETETEAGTEGEDGSTTTTTSSDDAAGPRPPSDVTVLVANGSGVSGAATRVAETVSASGYDTAGAANARDRVDASVIYHAEGFEDEAAALAATLTPTPAVQVLPDPPPVDDLGGASVVLVLGEDLAGEEAAGGGEVADDAQITD